MGRGRIKIASHHMRTEAQMAPVSRKNLTEMEDRVGIVMEIFSWEQP